MLILLAATAGEPPLTLPGDGYGAFLVQSLLALVAVCVLAWVVLRFGLRRLHAPQSGASAIQIIARTTLEPRRTLYIVEAAGKTLLLGTTDNGPIATLAELDSSALGQAAAVPPKRRFAELLRRDG